MCVAGNDYIYAFRNFKRKVGVRYINLLSIDSECPLKWRKEERAVFIKAVRVASDSIN